MKRGPEAGRRPRTLPACVDVASRCWGGSPPDWVLALAQVCDRSSQHLVAKEIGCSAGVVSGILRNSYPGDVGRVEIAIRGALMAHTVGCPVLDEIPAHECLEHQRRPFAATNPQRVRLYKACRSGCPHSRLKGDSNGR